MTKNDLADKLVPVFWLSLLGAEVAGFVAPPGTSRWIAIGYVGLVGLFVLEKAYSGNAARLLGLGGRAR